MLFVSELARASLITTASISSVQTFRNTDEHICRSLHFSQQPHRTDRAYLESEVTVTKAIRSGAGTRDRTESAELSIERPYLATAFMGSCGRVCFVMSRVARQERSYSLYQPRLFLDTRLQFLEMSNWSTSKKVS